MSDSYARPINAEPAILLLNAMIGITRNTDDANTTSTTSNAIDLISGLDTTTMMMIAGGILLGLYLIY